MKVSIDSRTVEAGDIFIPVKGPHFDGHDFIPEAVRKGARVLDVDLAQYAKRYRRKLKCSVLAITGSAGKTTSKDMLYSVLSQKYKVVKTLENQNNEVGVPLTILRADYETDILLLEMGMRGLGQIRYLAQIARPTHCVITNIGFSHIELLGSQRKIAQAKSELFLKPLVWERENRYAFLNHAGGFYDYLVRRAQRTGYQVLPFGGQEKPEQNINMCFTIGRHFGLSDEEIRWGLDQYQPSAHRMIRHQLDGVTLLDDSYNANPDGVAYSLQQLRRYPGRKIFVFGDMLELGEFSEVAHNNVVDWAIDSEVDLIFSIGTATAMMKSDDLSIMHFESKAQLVEQLLQELKSGDVVLVKGSRGMGLDEVVDILVRERK